jgi:hypothetical protein
MKNHLAMPEATISLSELEINYERRSREEIWPEDRRKSYCKDHGFVIEIVGMEGINLNRLMAAVHRIGGTSLSLGM